ncbi:hypothetical protein KIPB_003031 [Kipferlia bialata]|uniref:Uncharacterized protein n=1 Tax=Kipferlia bialata TaxID=797122 RepID=A0A9K3GGW8_9EUKA|nr:hypothetical protein KIPB_003031 [Kipferlia bialata]|eukprot:g3031.t1
MSDVTFQPSISQASLAITSSGQGRGDVVDRLHQWDRLRNEKRQRQLQRREGKELQGCTFRPNTSMPPSHSASAHGSRVSQSQAGVRHALEAADPDAEMDHLGHMRAIGQTGVVVDSVAAFVQRQERARTLRREREGKGAEASVPGSKWTPGVTQVSAFSLGHTRQRPKSGRPKSRQSRQGREGKADEHCRSLLKPVTPKTNRRQGGGYATIHSASLAESAALRSQENTPPMHHEELGEREREREEEGGLAESLVSDWSSLLGDIRFARLVRQQHQRHVKAAEDWSGISEYTRRGLERQALMAMIEREGAMIGGGGYSQHSQSRRVDEYE